MKALSVRQPWAWLILHGGKDIENRAWRTSYRGQIAVHASKKLHRAEWTNALMLIRDRGIPRPTDGAGCEIPFFFRQLQQQSSVLVSDEIELGSVLGTVEIVDCVDSSPSPWFTGPFGLVLRNPISFERPIPAKGALSFWEFSESK